jgi:hypothetical protein
MTQGAVYIEVMVLLQAETAGWWNSDARKAHASRHLPMTA